VPAGNAASFGYQSRNIQQFLKGGSAAAVPPMRTLLTTGIVDAMMRSRWEGHRLVHTPELSSLRQENGLYSDFSYIMIILKSGSAEK
jgi:hypothetical protein